jgi:hypothetical protein
VDCNQKLKGFLPILPNHLRISFKIVKTTKEHEHDDKCTQINKQKMPAKERKHEMFLVAAGTTHMRNCRNISNPEHTNEIA